MAYKLKNIKVSKTSPSAPTTSKGKGSRQRVLTETPYLEVESGGEITAVDTTGTIEPDDVIYCYEGDSAELYAQGATDPFLTISYPAEEDSVLDVTVEDYEAVTDFTEYYYEDVEEYYYEVETSDGTIGIRG